LGFSTDASTVASKPTAAIGAQTTQGQTRYDRDKLFPAIQPRRLETAARYFLPDTKRQQPREAAPRAASARPRQPARADPRAYARYFEARAKNDGDRFAPPVLRITAEALVGAAPSTAAGDVDITAGPLTVKKTENRVRFTHEEYGFADFTLADEADLLFTSPDAVVFGAGYFDVNWQGDEGSRAEDTLSNARAIVKLLNVRPRDPAKPEDDYRNELAEYCKGKKLALIEYDWEGQTLWFYAQSCRDGPYDFAAAQMPQPD
jgi:hypothetical protein